MSRMIFHWYFTIDGETFHTKKKEEFDFLKMFATAMQRFEVHGIVSRPAKILLDELRRVNTAKRRKTLRDKLTTGLARDFFDEKRSESHKKLGLNKFRFISNELR
jgi:hypothetical protein